MPLRRVDAYDVLRPLLAPQYLCARHAGSHIPQRAALSAPTLLSSLHPDVLPQANPIS